MEKTIGKLAVIARTGGIKLEGNDAWFNPGTDKVKEYVKTLQKGDEVELEMANGNISFITKTTAPGVSEEKIGEPKKDLETVDKFKVAEADKYMFGMSLNNAAVLMSMSSEEFKFAKYWDMVKLLYEDGRKLRKELLGY